MSVLRWLVALRFCFIDVVMIIVMTTILPKVGFLFAFVFYFLAFIVTAAIREQLKNDT